jgi:hypothetical protein
MRTDDRLRHHSATVAPPANNARPRHNALGCGGRAPKAELLTGIEGVSSQTVRKILLLADDLTQSVLRRLIFPAATAAPRSLGWHLCGPAIPPQGSQ